MLRALAHTRNRLARSHVQISDRMTNDNEESTSETLRCVSVLTKKSLPKYMGKSASKRLNQYQPKCENRYHQSSIFLAASARSRCCSYLALACFSHRGSHVCHVYVRRKTGSSRKLRTRRQLHMRFSEISTFFLKGPPMEFFFAVLWSISLCVRSI